MPVVKMDKEVTGSRGVFAPGRVLTVDEATALEWERIGVAHRVDAETKEASPEDHGRALDRQVRDARQNA